MTRSPRDTPPASTARTRGHDGRVPPPPGTDERPPDQPLTEFQRAVVDVVGALDPGDIVTYADVALEVGRPGAAQAVANVLRRVHGLPWWRVIPTSGRLYCSHEPTQRPLLEAEGVTIGPDRRVEA